MKPHEAMYNNFNYLFPFAIAIMGTNQPYLYTHWQPYYLASCICKYIAMQVSIKRYVHDMANALAIQS